MLRAGDDNGVELWESGAMALNLPSLGRILSTLFSLQPPQLQHVLSHDHAQLQKSKIPAGRAAASLLHYIMDSIRKEASLEYICVPLLQQVVKSKDRKNRKHVKSLFEWLFQQHSEVGVALAKSLSLIIGEPQCEKRVKLGWCIVVRDLVQITFDSEETSRKGKLGVFSLEALMIIANSVSHLVQIVCNDSVQDGKECSPTRLTTMAADCILVITRALSEPENLLRKDPYQDDNCFHPKGYLGGPASQAFGAEVVGALRDGSQMVDTDTNYSVRPGDVASLSQKVLWSKLDDLIVLVSELYKWNYRTRSLHSKGLQQVLKHLKVLANFQQALRAQEHDDSSVGEEVLKLCWKQYSTLMITEDQFNLSSSETLLQQYVDALQESMYQSQLVEVEGSQVHDSSQKEEIKGYALGCLALLLGRFDVRHLDTVLVKSEPQLLQILLYQLCSKDDDIVDLVVVILKAILFRTTVLEQNDSTTPRMSQMETIAPMFLDLLDKRDSTSRAVVTLIAEYFSANPESSYFEKLFSFLDSEDAMQRKNALDVLSELWAINSKLVDAPESVLCQKIAKLLIARLGDEELTNRIQASSLFSKLDPTYVLPALLQSMFSLDGRVRSAASSAILAVLNGCPDQCRVISVLLDCVRCLENVIRVPDHPGQIGKNNLLNIGMKALQGGSTMDADRIMHLVPKWAASVRDWDSVISFILDKMFGEPSNPVIPKFLSKISSHLADNTNVVYDIIFRVLKEQPVMLEGYIGHGGVDDTSKSLDGTLANDLFQRLSPLLVLKVLPLRAYDDMQCQILYDSSMLDCVSTESTSIASILVNRMCALLEFEDVRKLSAELVGRLLPQVMLPQILEHLKGAISNIDTLRAKACIFALCNSLTLREESVKHPLMKIIQELLCSVFLWTNANNSQEVEKTQHGCIDCFALMIRAELVFASSRNSILPHNADLRCQMDFQMSVLSKVLNSLLGCNDMIFFPERFTSSSPQTDFSWTSQCSTAQQNIEGGKLLLEKSKLDGNEWKMKCRPPEGFVDTVMEIKEVTKLTDSSVDAKEQHSVVPIALRVCMANILISACSKIPPSTHQLFSVMVLPPIVNYAQDAKDSYLRAACLQVLFTSVYHLKSATVISSSPDLIRLSVTSLRGQGIPEERINAAKLLAALLATEEALEEIKPHLMDVQLALTNISHLDPSAELRAMCDKLLSCMSTTE
ncbi:hypothetical protein O6H91_12G043800 [Diphasiastrum complanatum]|uniref:Uncharacterized protein n=3 Tax=Diphasiastrum complanatum TaxID=34168 RepID=A0ACC2C151_DIPCM|nr:hypothetical protein O6H91_12G043800 [Diphasiastrum complanatum]KAJ7535727.1 hypothetical protein O6H91_12G043800 [Diphasiastrum complanatum]KAJ7535730.1 hypothetical protein O6H91_12G043800 [Diphasiastrum complanatum]